MPKTKPEQGAPVIETEVEDGVMFISEVKPLEEEPKAPTVSAADGACPHCGRFGLIDIRRAYYCTACAKESPR